jgi:hypothetical protein
MITQFSVRYGKLGSFAATFAWGMLAWAALSASPAAAGVVTFASYTETNASQDQWSISTSVIGLNTATTISASGEVEFSFSGAGLPFSTGEDATFTLNATSVTAGNTNGSNYAQGGYYGSFSIVETAADADPGANLLSGVFQVVGTGAQITSTVNGSGGSFDASATTGDLNQLMMTSAFVNLAGQTYEDSSWALSSLSPIFTTSGAPADYPTAGPFDASGLGTFASNPGASPVPEPATFGLIGGALLLGLGGFRRKRVLVGA